MTEDFYDLLGVDEDASQDDIKEAFREKVREYHPDLNDDPRAQAQFTALKKAYDTLGNPSERNAYDRMGHEDYVVKRTQGLPSQDVWAQGGDGSSSDDETATGASASSGTAASTGSTSSSGRSRTSAGATGSTSTRSESSTSGRSSRSSGSTSSSSRTSSSSSTSSSKSSSSSSGSSTSSATGTTGASTGSTDSRSTATGAATSSTSTGSSRSSASASRASATGTATGSYGGTSTTTAETDTGSEGLVARLLRTKVGWPGIVLADAVYLVGAVLFALANRGALRSFAEALSTAETATIRAAATAAPAEPLSTYLYGTTYVAATDFSARAAVLVAGAVLLPFVYAVVVKRTRRSSLRWKPTWLYVVCTLGPLAGVAANLAGYAYVGVDVVAFYVLPVLAAVALPLSAFVRPLLVRVFFDG
jgi:curved DNA-binding protein CbpA